MARGGVVRFFLKKIFNFFFFWMWCEGGLVGDGVE